MKKDYVVISEKELLALMRRAFDEGYVGYHGSCDSVVSALLDEWKNSHNPVLDEGAKWAVAHAATSSEAALRNSQGKLRAQFWTNP